MQRKSSVVRSSPEQSPAPVSPAKQLADGDAQRVKELEKAIDQLWRAGKFAEADPAAREILAIHEHALPVDDWRIADARKTISELRTLASLPDAGQREMAAVRELAERASPSRTNGQIKEAERLRRQVLESTRRWLGTENRNVATGCINLAMVLQGQQKFQEAESLLREAVEINRKARGPNHPHTAIACGNLAILLARLDRSDEAERLHREALSIRRKVLGELDSATLQSCHSLAAVLDREDKFAEAEVLHRQVVTLRSQVFGRSHAMTAQSMNNLALNLDYQGRHTEAERTLRDTLAIWDGLSDEFASSRASCLDNLSLNLLDQGRYAEAEGFSRRALAIELQIPERDPLQLATRYNNLAGIRAAQGEYQNAEDSLRRALNMRTQILGRENSATLQSVNNLASNLKHQDRLLESEALHRDVIAILERKPSPESRPDLANSYTNLGTVLGDQGRFEEAEAFQRQAIKIWKKALGQENLLTSASYNNLGAVLNAQSKYDEAEIYYRKALEVQTKVRGADHPNVAATWASLAENFEAMGKPKEALEAWSTAVTVYSHVRRNGSSIGLERATLPLRSPLPGLAVLLADLGRSREAWAHGEESLSRGLLDEVIGRLARPLTAEEREQEARLQGQAQAIQERQNKLMGRKVLTQPQEKLLADLKQQGGELRRQLLELEQQIEARRGEPTGQTVNLEARHQFLSEGTALLGWIDRGPHHMACVLRHTGDPIWVRLPGSAKDGAWTKEDRSLTQRLRPNSSRTPPRAGARPLADALARQRLDPLKEHLKGVERLVVVNSPGLGGVPIEALMAARPDPAWDSITVSYVPSASMFAHLAGKPMPRRSSAPTLLALADPAYLEAGERRAATDFTGYGRCGRPRPPQRNRRP